METTDGGGTRGHTPSEAQFTAFARQHETSLLRTAWLLTGSTQTAAGAVRAALEQTCAAWPRLRPDTALTLARRAVAAHAVEDWGQSGSPRARAGSSPAEDGDETRHWLATLPSAHRTAVVLRVYCGLTDTEAAEALGTTPDGVASSLALALQALHEQAVTARAHLGGYTRPTGPDLPRPTGPAPVAEPLTPEDVRARLHALTPAHFPPVDLRPVLRHGRRVVRRRRLATALVAAVVLAGAVGGATSLMRRLEPAPAPSLGPAASVTLESRPFPAQDGSLPAATRFLVSLGAASDDGQRSVRYAVEGTAGVMGPGIDERHRHLTWQAAAGATDIVGVIPSGAARDRIFVEYREGYAGGSTSTVVPIPGTDYSAFVVSLDHPLGAGSAAMPHLVWFDRGGHPVDEEGRVGALARVCSMTVWVSPDGEWWEVGGGLNLYTDIAQTVATDDHDQSFVVALVHRQITTASRLTAVLDDGSEHEVTSVPLGPDRAFCLPAPTDPVRNRVAAVRWTDASGKVQTQAAISPS